MAKKKNGTVWSIPVPRSLDSVVEMVVELGTYSGKSDFVRDSVRRNLTRLGFKTVGFKTVVVTEEALKAAC